MPSGLVIEISSPRTEVSSRDGTTMLLECVTCMDRVKLKGTHHECEAGNLLLAQLSY